MSGAGPHESHIHVTLIPAEFLGSIMQISSDLPTKLKKCALNIAMVFFYESKSGRKFVQEI